MLDGGSMDSPETVRFPVFGDLHLGFDEESWEKAAGALEDAISLGPDLLAFMGDVVDLDPQHWRLFGQLQEINPGLPFRVTRGNADFLAGGDEAWLRQVGHPIRSVLDVGRVRLLTVGAQSEDHELPLGEGFGEWLAQAAAARPEATVVVLCHAPLKDTTFWSCDNTESGCLAELLAPDNPPYHLYLAQSDEMLQAVERSPNIRLFLTGHVHNDHRMVCDHGYPPIIERDGVVHMVTANLGGWRDIGVDRQEYRWIDIDHTRIRARVRNFVGATWVPELEETFPLRAS
ncbi:MAG: hypothetical protein GF320_07585 [Armatimonadia bacterium]|nr:hypothetical protein [Armatimonadia bacterium]